MGNYLCCCICLKKADNEVVLEKNKKESLSLSKDLGVEKNSPLSHYYPKDFHQNVNKQSNLVDKNKANNHRNLSKTPLEDKLSMHAIEESKKKDHLAQNNEIPVVIKYSSENHDSVTNQRLKGVKVKESDFIQKANQDEHLLQNDKKNPQKIHSIANHDPSVNQRINDNKAIESIILEKDDQSKDLLQNDIKESPIMPSPENYSSEVKQIYESIKINKINIKENLDQKVPFLPLRGKSIMVIGETGTGKSAFLNLLGNTLENTEIQDIKIYFKLKKITKLSDEILAIYHEKIKTVHQSKIIYTNSISIVEIKNPVTNDSYTLIDTPGILTETDGSPDEQFIEIIKELFNVVKKVDCLIFLEKSNTETCSRTTQNTISRLEDDFNKKIGKVVPVFTFYPGSLIFNKDSVPFAKEMQTVKAFKINNLIFGYSNDDRITKADKLKKTYKSLKTKMEKIMKVVDS